MDSLFANYASSDEEEEGDQQQQPQEPKIAETPSKFAQIPKPSFISLSLPEPKQPLSSLFSSLPPPETSSSSVFNSIPPPSLKSSTPNQPKRVVQFKPPINPAMLKPLEDDEDEDEEEEERKPIKNSTSLSETSSVKSFFSSLPAPKSSRGLGSGSGPTLGRKSIVETEVPKSNFDGVRSNLEENEGMGNAQKADWGDGGNYEGKWIDRSGSTASNEGGSGWQQSNVDYGSYGHYGNYENYGDQGGSYVHYDQSTVVAQSMDAGGSSGVAESMARLSGKRGRKDIPAEIVEVKQDELMKNKPREDQVKTTGIAFGPSYQPVSTKGKPTKLHKRKHQIGSLYFDMRQKEMELAERRAKGFLTKAETQAKYGWHRKTLKSRG